MKIVTVVGSRSQLVKAAAISRELRNVHTEILVYIRQHLDCDISQQFFEDFDIRKPKYIFERSGDTHAEMTARMLSVIEEILQKEKPDMVLLYGDTDSTVVGANAASKLHITICHIEADEEQIV